MLATSPVGPKSFILFYFFVTVGWFYGSVGCCFLLVTLLLCNPCTRCTMWECHMVISGLLVESLCRELGTGVPGHRVVCQVYRVLGGSAGRARQTWFCDLGETMVQLASASPWAEHFLSFYNSSLFFLHFKKSIHDNYMYLWGTM